MGAFAVSARGTWRNIVRLAPFPPVALTDLTEVRPKAEFERVACQTAPAGDNPSMAAFEAKRALNL
jgi:hypothetical protein